MVRIEEIWMAISKFVSPNLAWQNLASKWKAREITWIQVLPASQAMSWAPTFVYLYIDASRNNNKHPYSHMAKPLAERLVLGAWLQAPKTSLLCREVRYIWEYSHVIDGINVQINKCLRSPLDREAGKT